MLHQINRVRAQIVELDYDIEQVEAVASKATDTDLLAELQEDRNACMLVKAELKTRLRNLLKGDAQDAPPADAPPPTEDAPPPTEDAPRQTWVKLPERRF